MVQYLRLLNFRTTSELVMNPDVNFLNIPASPLNLNVQTNFIPTQQSTNSLSLPSYAIRTDQTISINGGGDLDGDPFLPLDDALIYAAKGFTFNNIPTLPVNRDSLTGAPILDSLTGKQVLVNNAVTVSAGYNTSNANGNNPYIGLVPPQIVSPETITIPTYSDTKTQELNIRKPSGSPTFIFHANSNPINNINDWNSKFPSPGTSTKPKVVKVTNGGLNIPNGVNLSNYIITVERGDINFNGNSNSIDNVVLVADSGNINLGKVQSNQLSVFASGTINMNGQARFGGKTLIANNSGSITFNGATKTANNADMIKVISQGNITFNGASDVRGDFLSIGTFNANGRANIFGSINAKQNITFNGGAYVTAVNTNSAPTNLILSNNITPENVSANSLIGNFNTTDSNLGNIFTYSLISGTGSTDNSAFSITNNELRIVNSPDFEAKNSYDIRVKTTDQGGLIYEKAFTVSITDVNEAPISLVLSNNTTPENVAANSLIGTFTTTDPDTTPQSFTYSLVTGTGSTDNSVFTIINNELRIISSPDFESKNSYSIRVRTTDQGGLIYEKAFTVSITDVNEAPISLVLSNNTTPENVTANSLIGTFASTDTDTTSQTFTYSLVAGTGSTDNNSFAIANNELRIINSPDFEAKNSYSIRVRTTDQGGLSFEKVFTVSITDVNEAPTALVLSNNTTPENVAANSLIGTFASTDPDTTPQTFTYSLVTGTGSTDNNSFTIAANNELRIINSPDFEAKNSYSIRVRTTDQGGLSFEKVFTVSITDVNEDPVFISTTIQNPNQPYQYNITTTDPENDRLNITATNLPTWLTLTDNQDGTAQLIGNPKLAPSGIYNIQLKAKEANTLERLEVSQTFAIAVDNTPPAIAIQLQQDTGISTDKITNNPAIAGTVTDSGTVTGTIVELKAGFAGTANIDIFDTLSNGTFNLSSDRLNQIAGSTLSNGQKTITISAQDNSGNISTLDFTFTLDTTAPQTPGFTLDSAFDTAPIGDAQTTLSNVKLTGLTEANATITLGSTSIKADGVGKFIFSNVLLNLGDNSFTVNAQDLAGNTSLFTTNIKRVAPAQSDVVLDWNATLLNAIAIERSAPPVASRHMAIVQTAIFDTINSFTNTYNNYHFVGTAPTGASIEAAAASAAYRTLINLYPNQASFLNAALVTSLAQIPDGTAEDAGVAFGQTVANDILLFRSTDGSSDPTVYTPETNPGDWQPTAPAFGLALLPKWGEVTPFGLTSGSQFRPAGEPDLTSDRYTSDFNQVKELGKIDSTTRTADQTEIAKFWADGAGTYTPPGHWNQIAQNIVAGQGNSLLSNARLFALLDIGLADAGIAAWDAKYTYASWRPITAIQKADTDGNPNTTADPNWKPLIVTPPFPDYVSGHSTFSGTADSILTGLLGNNISFTTNSLGTPGVYRSFSNFATAANEAGISRVYGGIHFGFSNVDGLATGRSVGNYVLQNLLTPYSQPTFSLSNNTTVENVPANSVIGTFTSNNSQSSYTLVSGTGDTDNSAFSIINNQLRILNSPDFETKNSYKIRVKDQSGASQAFTIAILDINEGSTPAIAIQLQQDTGFSNTDKITNNPVIAGTVTGNITELKAGFNNTPTFDILGTLTNGNFTLDQNIPITDGQKTLTISAKDSLGNQNILDFTFTLDTSAPQTPSLILDPAYDTGSVGDLQTQSTNVKLTGQTEANAKVTLLGRSPISADSTGEFAFTNVPLNLGDNTFTVNAEDLAGNTSNLTTIVKRVEIQPEVIQVSVKPGAQIQIESTEIFGMAAEFSIEYANDMPNGKLEGDGTLILKPAPTDLGTYEFSLIARDGDLVFTKQFILNVVPDPDTTTRISGVIKSTDQTALAGIAVRVGNFVATTAADGSFTITMPEPPPEGTAMLIQPDQEAEGILYPSIAEKLPLVLEHDVYANANNIIQRPIYLPPIDIANAKTINPNINQTVTSAAISGSSVFVAANSLFDHEGNPYTGKLSITTVPRDFTPAALPENLIPDLVVTIQPGEMVFAIPAPLSLPNLAGYAPGTLMDLWSINPVTGLFDNVGTGEVSADGKVVNTISGGIRNSSWHFFASVPNPPDPFPTADPYCDVCVATSPSNSEVELGSGAEIETHDLVSYQSLGETRSLQLVYSSKYADPRPIVHSSFDLVNTIGDIQFILDNRRFTAELTLQRGGFTIEAPGIESGQFGLSGGENFWRLSGEDTADLALQVDLSDALSGVYQYQMRSGLLTRDPDTDTLAGSLSSTTGDVLVINKIESDFGSGWSLSGLQEIVVNPDRSVLLIDGGGRNLIFKSSEGGQFTPPPGSNSTLEGSNGSFQLTDKYQTVSRFDSQNRLVSVTDRQGNQTQHIYNAQGISKIVDPTGLETNFTYNSGKVSSITDPSGKVTVLEYSDAGDLVRVTDPDGTSRSWQYNERHSKTYEIDQQGRSAQTSYDEFGRVTGATLKDGSSIGVKPLEVNGLFSPRATMNFSAAPRASKIREAAEYTNSAGNDITTVLDNRGQAESSRDETGKLPTTTRDRATNMVTSTADASGNITSYTYDGVGNVLTSTTSNSTRRYAYDPIFNQVTSETDEMGRKTLYEIDPLTGNPRSMSRVVGAVGGDDDLITRYTYTPQGLVDIMTDPLERMTDYDYDAQGRTIKITFAKGTADEAAQQFEYDLAGNQTANIDELGRRTEYRYDLQNRLIATIYPDNTPETLADNPRTQTEYDLRGNQVAVIDELGRRTTFAYDVRDRLIKTTEPDPDGAGALVAPEMRYEYDPNGNQTAMIDQLGRRTEYEYDARNRLIATIYPDLSRESSSYDLDNNLIVSRDANSNLTTREYDARGRLTKLNEPNGSSTFEYDNANQLVAQTDANGNLTRYEYDELGRRIKTIDALDGITITSYDKNGNVISETDQLNRTTAYGYDNRDRQITTTTALGFTNRTIYDRVNNVISEVDANSHGTSYIYDLRNRPIEVIDALNQSTKTTYDAVGNVISTTNALNQISTIRYDHLNRQIESIDPLLQSTKTEYDAFGNVVAVVDALGQRTSFGYDFKNRRNTVTDALGKVTTTTYDPFGNILSITDPENNQTSYEFPVLDPIIRVNEARKLTSVDGISVDGTSRDLSISADGRFIAFLIDDNYRDELYTYVTSLYVRDLVTGQTSLVNINGNGISTDLSISGDGRFIAFSSDSNNLVTDDDNRNRDIFVHDRITGQTTRVSVNSNGLEGDGSSNSPTISADGRFIAFDSFASNLVAGDTNGKRDVFFHDQVTGQTTKVSEGTEEFFQSSISADGKFITFMSGRNSYIYDQSTGETTKVGNSYRFPIISANGKYLALSTDDAQTGSFSYELDVSQGEGSQSPPKLTFDLYNSNQPLQSVTLLFNTSVTTSGSVTNNSTYPTDFEVLIGLRYRLVPNVSIARFEILPPLSIIGEQAYYGVLPGETRPYGPFTDLPFSYYNYNYNYLNNSVTFNPGNPSFSSFIGDGSLDLAPSLLGNITIAGGGGNLTSDIITTIEGRVTIDYNSGDEGVFVQDLATGEITKVNGDGLRDASISADGRFITFTSSASNLVVGDTNGVDDIFVFDLVTKETSRVSVNGNGVEGNGKSYGSQISADGRFITFKSSASNLVPADTNGNEDIFVALNNRFVVPNVNRLTGEVNANGEARKYSYDPIGNITSVTDRDGTTQRYTYDKLNRRTQEEWLDLTGTVTRTITNTYNAAGELTQISDPDSTYRYTYDLDGRMLSVSNQGTPNVPATVMTYGYDNVGNDLTITESINGITGVTTSHQFDALNRLTVNTQGNSRVDYTYNALSQVTNRKRYSDPTGTNLVAETTHTYDQLNRLTDIVHSNGANTISSYTQTYDEGSKITGITSTDGVSTYTYDDTDQLVGADYNFQTDENYTYDDNGNRTNTGYVTGINNRLLEDSKYRYEYDKVGNRTKRTNKTTNEVTEYTWDVRDRLIGFKLKNASGTVIKSATYIYDVYDQRIAKIVDPDGVGSLPAMTERFVYGSSQNIALVFDGNGTLKNRYLFGNGIDQIEADEQVATGTTLWALPDHLGSVRDVVDDSGVTQNHIVYDAFGNIISQTNSSVIFKFGYTGREFDAESGLQYNRARYIDTFTGRFISEDPIGFAGGDANIYRYVGNNAINAIDPLGLWGKVVFQQRHIAYTHSGSIADAEQTAVYPNGLPLIGLGIPEQIYYPPLSRPFPATPIPNFRGVNANPPISTSAKVISDFTKASIEWSDSEPAKGTVEPWGGLYRVPRSDENGHIIPRELGGKKEANNFFSQNMSINRGGYAVFGTDVRKYLDQLHKDCPSSTAKVELTVDLRHTGTGAISGYPLRPDRVEVIAVFSDGKRISGWFSNVHGVSSNRGTSFNYNKVPY